MFSNITIKTRLIYVVGLLSLLIICVGGLGLYGIDQSNKGLKSVYENRTVPTVTLANINDHLQVIRMNAVIAANLNNIAVARARASDTARRDAEIQKIWNVFSYSWPETWVPFLLMGSWMGYGWKIPIWKNP